MINNNITIEEKQVTKSTSIYQISECNSLGETLTIEIVKCTSDNNRKNSLPNLWVKHGFTDTLFNSYWNVTTYVYDSKGNCRMKYNPQVKWSDDQKCYVINFNYMCEATEENKKMLINEIIKRFFDLSK